MVGEEGEGTGKQASALAAIYVDFTSGLREITLVGLPLARSHDEGWCGLVVGMKRGVGGGVGGGVGVVCAGISCHHFPASCKLTCII